jgi:hypothetical protein
MLSFSFSEISDTDSNSHCLQFTHSASCTAGGKAAAVLAQGKVSECPSAPEVACCVSCGGSKASSVPSIRCTECAAANVFTHVVCVLSICDACVSVCACT